MPAESTPTRRRRRRAYSPARQANDLIANYRLGGDIAALAAAVSNAYLVDEGHEIDFQALQRSLRRDLTDAVRGCLSAAYGDQPTNGGSTR